MLGGSQVFADVQTGVAVIFLSQRLVESSTYSEVFQRFFDAAYPAAGV
jgi:hypothetical protein